MLKGVKEENEGISWKLKGREKLYGTWSTRTFFILLFTFKIRSKEENKQVLALSKYVYFKI